MLRRDMSRNQVSWRHSNKNCRKARVKQKSNNIVEGTQKHNNLPIISNDIVIATALVSCARNATISQGRGENTTKANICNQTRVKPKLNNQLTVPEKS